MNSKRRFSNKKNSTRILPTIIRRKQVKCRKRVSVKKMDTKLLRVERATKSFLNLRLIHKPFRFYKMCKTLGSDRLLMSSEVKQVSFQVFPHLSKPSRLLMSNSSTPLLWLEMMLQVDFLLMTHLI